MYLQVGQLKPGEAFEQVLHRSISIESWVRRSRIDNEALGNLHGVRRHRQL